MQKEKIPVSLSTREAVSQTGISGCSINKFISQHLLKEKKERDGLWRIKATALSKLP